MNLELKLTVHSKLQICWKNICRCTSRLAEFNDSSWQLNRCTNSSVDY